MKRQNTLFYRITFFIYAVIMLWLLFGQRIARWNDGYDISLMLSSINLIPFRTVYEFIGDLGSGGRSHALINLLGNVIMFVPLGFFIPAVFSKVKSFRSTVLWSFAAIVCIEILQLVSLLGSFDMDDILLNLTGAVIGYAVYKAVSARCSK